MSHRSTNEADAYRHLKPIPDLEQRLFQAIPEVPFDGSVPGRTEAVALKARLAKVLAELIHETKEEFVFLDSESGTYFRDWDNHFDNEGRQLAPDDEFPLPEKCLHATTNQPVKIALEDCSRLEGFGIDLHDYLRRSGLFDGREVLESNRSPSIRAGEMYRPWVVNLPALSRMVAENILKETVTEAIKATPDFGAEQTP